MTFTDWLRQCGLEQYTRNFAENDIDFSVARKLTESDLKELGLTLGHRKRFLEALESLGTELVVSRKSADVPTQAERRQLTIMFCDLVGSTALSKQLDPETLRNLMQQYQQTCGGLIERYEGHVAQYLGDGLMVYFGWPRAHEDDAERAVRTALEVASAVGRITGQGISAPLQVRIGIATGPVVVGETGGGDAAIPKLAVGETPNIAARLQALANPDQIVIAPSTHRLLHGTFECDDLGQHTLKGIIETVNAWRVRGIGANQGRFEAAHKNAVLTDFIGRESELALLADRWLQSTNGEGQVVLLCGEPGIGKSRMTQAIDAHVASQPHQRLTFQCAPYHTQSALYPVIGVIEKAVGLQRDENGEQSLDRLEAWLELVGKPSPNAGPLIAHLLSLASDRYPPLAYSQQKQKDLLLLAIVDQIVGLSRRAPLLMSFEDAHWIDPTTQEWLDLLVPRVASARVLLLFTYRPEYVPRWSGEAHLTTLTLNRLNARLGATMVQRVTRGKSLPKVVLDQIVSKTDGIPLFVEELTKAVIESGLLRETSDSFELDGPLPPLAIPSTLHDSLMARLDRLASVKEIAQLAACIGRDFSFELLSAVSTQSTTKLTEALDQLVQVQLIFRNGTPPEATYTFKHALIRDAAYESLLKTRRQELHAVIARELEKRTVDSVVQEPDVVAHHFSEAGMHAQATTYWIQAAQRAVERFANIEAMGYVERGLETLRALPEGTDRNQKELLLQVSLGTALGSSKGYTPPEVGAAFHRARVLCEDVGHTPQMYSVLFGLWVYYVMRADFDASHLLDEQLLELGRINDDSGASIAGHYSSCGTKLFTGKFSEALRHSDEAWALYAHAKHQDLAYRFGFDTATGSQDFSAWALLYLGYPDQSTHRINTALDMAKALNHPLTTATTIVHATCMDYLRNDAQAALQRSQETVAICNESGILIRQVEAEIVQGWALSMLGNAQDGVPIMEAALVTWNMIGAQIANPMWYTCLSRAYAVAGRIDDAWTALAQAKSYVEKNSERQYEAEIHRWEGELFLAHSQNEAGAEICFQNALRVACSQDAKLWELRAAVALARLWNGQGKRREAHALLAPVHAWFTEGFDTEDLIVAERLLANIS